VDDERRGGAGEMISGKEFEDYTDEELLEWLETVKDSTLLNQMVYRLFKHRMEISKKATEMLEKMRGKS